MAATGIQQKRSERLSVARGLLVLAVLLVYGSGIHGAFIFDDKASIPENPSLHGNPWLLSALHPPHGTGCTVDGRPVLNLSFALNYAFGGVAVEGYHLTNILIQATACLLLFGIVRRTARICDLPDPIAIAFFIALIWATHPLDTESVTYLVQRAESLMGLFYLLTLYGYVRSLDSEHGFFWLNVSVAACCLGMGTKEVMVSAPLTVLLFDRTFVSGSFREALRGRGSYYGALAASWIVLAALVYSTHARGSTVGFGIGVSWPAYLASQPMAILHYLCLAFLPLGQNFDYGLIGVGDWRSALLTAPVVLGLGIVSIVGVVRATPWGFLGWCFFAVLAPTSLLPGVRQAIAEHRMYLALIPVVVLAILACHRQFGRRAYPFYFAATLVFWGLTIRRNAFYRNEVVLYTDAVEQSPDNPFALSTLGGIMMERGDLDGAALLFQRSIQVQRINQVARDNLGAILIKKGKVDAAIAVYREAIAYSPRFANAHVNLGNALLLKGLPQAAISSYRDAEELDPASPAPENGMAVAYARLGAPLEAVEHYNKSLALDPENADTHNNMGNAYRQAKRLPEAFEQFAIAISLKPSLQSARFSIASLLAERGELAESIVQYRAAIQIGPDSALARDNLGVVLERAGQPEEAEAGCQVLFEAVVARANRVL